LADSGARETDSRAATTGLESGHTAFQGCRKHENAAVFVRRSASPCAFAHYEFFADDTLRRPIADTGPNLPTADATDR